MPWVEKNRCNQCNICIEECPVSAIEIKNEYPQIDNNICTRCARCIDVCPNDAIRPNSENPNLRGRRNGTGRKSGFGKGRNRESSRKEKRGNGRRGGGKNMIV